ncbi:MAG TPA: methanogenesis marker 12 protein [Methanosarcinaceae archaeon]|nr:methanogenesis marker 12 protein [Methanosarcinaceae archaeon]
MMFVGIDHGTTAMRFVGIAGDSTKKFELLRREAAAMSESEIIDTILQYFDIDKNEIKLIAVTYSMGDGITVIEDVSSVVARGVKSIEGAGEKTGGGARVFDAIKNSGLPAVLIPGIHAGSNTDPRMNVFSHSTSPEKIGIAYHAQCHGYDDFVVSDISSNTVTVGVANGKLVGAIDACIFAPGVHHGPLDLQAIRDVDAGICTANEAFIHAGVLKNTTYAGRKELLEGATRGEKSALLALDTIALFATMEIVSIKMLLKDYGCDEKIFLAGSVGEFDYVVDKINAHLGVKCHVLGKWSAATGCAEIARDIAGGAKDILGIKYCP